MNSNLNRVFILLILIISFVWLVVPFTMAVLWSLVDPSEPWTVDKIFPPVMSFYRWNYMWENSNLKEALLNSYVLAPSTALFCLILSMPTSYAFGRLNFPGKEIAKLLTLLPIVLPPFVTSIYFSSILFEIGFQYWKFGNVLIAHIVLFIPFAIRIMTVCFEQVKQDVIDAARDLSASRIQVFKVAYLPSLKSGIFASILIVFILSIEEFAIAFIIGAPDFITIPTILYSALGQDFVRPNAAVISLILVFPNVILMIFLERVLRSANPALISGK